MDSDDYQELVEKQVNENNKLLLKFESHLLESKLSEKTIQKHMSNLDFFVNHFLLYEEIIYPENGIDHINYYFNAWFPRKAMWSSPVYVTGTCTVLKKFYDFLLSKGMISKNNVAELTRLIKLGKPEWVSHYETSDCY